MTTMNPRWILALAGWLACGGALAQVNSGSNGSDGAFHPTTNTVINMADHPDGIYHYTSVHIPEGVTVTFIPNANNTPVVWLVQSNCVIDGSIDVSAPYVGHTSAQGGIGGPGGYRGGNSGPAASSGQGPGGGSVGPHGANASYASVGGSLASPSGPVYGNSFLIPLLGGSGGGGSTLFVTSGGGGGGAILIASSTGIELNGAMLARGGGGSWSPYISRGGGGSGGGVRLVAARVLGSGSVNAIGGFGNSDGAASYAGHGRIRIDALENAFAGTMTGSFTHGFQPVIIPIAGQLLNLKVATIGGVPVSASPSGQLSTPDALLSAQQSNPIPIVVQCANVPLNTQITVTVKPANGPSVSATGLNSAGTLASSTATVLLQMPRGGGILYATAATGN